ncbi:hypothetical protein AKJ09_08454 [Labilithrix luteola]|uniref:PatA-like N-terminal domain-containing protein n=2 Tax=Labilithrix luteola TaxID=1391654 RepID=A0A0K1Q7K1_9BACT|nr:hypothetical protein AKJ09_08454 [Labilithrix luteola]
MSDRDDLLRVDQTGAVHPVGRTASQQLRPRAGEWRLIPSPRDLIVARSMSGGDAVMKLAGEIRSPGALSDIVALAAQSNWKGELIVLSEKGTRSLYFEGGTIIAASTTIAEERLGETLYRFGVITREQLETIVRISTETRKRLGETAIETGIVAAEQLYSMMARQVEEVFFAAVHVTEGAFYFFDRFEERHILRRHSLNAGGLLMEAARRMDEMRFFREKIPGDAYIPVPVPGKKASEELEQVFAECDGQKSIADIGRAIGQLEFEVTRAVFQLVSSGCAFVVAPRPRGPEAIVETFNPALAVIHQRCDLAGKGDELREGLSRFATGGGVYDPLFMGAGPLMDGTLKPHRIASNIAMLAGDDDPDAWLVGLMNDYVGFALFQAESLLPRDSQSKLQADVMEILKPLRPLIDAGPRSRGNS